MVISKFDGRVLCGEAATGRLAVHPLARRVDGKINERGALVGETFVANAPTIDTRFDGWFGWTMEIGLMGRVALSGLRKNGRRNHA